MHCHRNTYLAMGAAPLPVMEAKMEEFIAGEKAKLAAIGEK